MMHADHDSRAHDQAPPASAEHAVDAAEPEVAPQAFAGAVADQRAREAAWRREAAPFAAELRIAPSIHADERSRALTDARGARGLAIGNEVHLHPDKIAPGTSDGRRVLVHELTHVAQVKNGVSAGIERAAAEHEATQVAADVADGKATAAPRQGISLAEPAADNGAPPAADDKALKAPDLKGAPYQWVPGTFNLWVSNAWYQGASDFTVDKGRWASPSRIRELLMVLRDKGMLTWASPERITKASTQLSISAADVPTSLIHLGTSAFDSLGLPPGTSALVGRDGQALEAVVAVPQVQVEEGKEFPLSVEAKQQLFTALEAYTGLPLLAGPKQQLLDAAITGTLGAGTFFLNVKEATCQWLWGKEAYDKWTAKPAGESQPYQFDVGAGNASVSDLSPDELKYVHDWLEQHLGKGTGGRPVVMSRLLLESLKKLDDLPEARRDRVLAMLHGTGKPAKPGAEDGQLSSAVLERLMQQAKFDEEREAAGFAPDKQVGNERPPVFDWPLPARIDQRNGLILENEQVEFSVLIDWPPAYTADQQSEYTWRPMKANIDWVFERQQGDKTKREQQTSHVGYKHNGHADHRFKLEPGEDSAIWTVHAFVHHNFFQPNHLVTQVEVKTEAKRLEELRKEAFEPLGQPGIDDKDHDFSTSTFNEWFGDREYDHGVRFRGALPADFKERTPDERKASIEAEIKNNEAMLVYLRAEGNSPDAVRACEHYLAKLRDTVKSMDRDIQDGWRPFEVRGTFLGRGNHVADGPLALHGAVRKQIHRTAGDEYSAPEEYEQVHVQIRDLSRRLDADDYRFEASADTFEQAVEAVFVKLAKKYPGGKVSMLAEELDPDGTKGTGKTVGFELDTGSEWKDVKAKVFDPVVNVAVNIAGAIAAIFVPEIAIPLLILYNEAQNVDQLVDEMDSGTLTTKKGLMHLAQLGLDVLPVAGQAAPVLRTSKAAFTMFHLASLGGQALLMKAQVEEQIVAIRDGQVKDMAHLYAEYVELEKNTQASDPARAEMKARLDKRVEEIRNTAMEVWEHAIKDFAVVAIPAHLAGAIHENYRRGRIADLESNGRFVNREGVEPHYDRTTGQIIGDQGHMDRPTINKLTKEQDAHLRELGGRLAEELRVDPDKIVLKPGDETKVWQDGDQIQARYAPGTEPEAAIAAWKAEAKKAKIGKPRPEHHGREQPRRPPPEPPATERPMRPSDHETVSETAKVEPQLAEGGHSSTHETTAAAVAGSSFTGHAVAPELANPAQVLADAHTAFEQATLLFGEVKSVERASSKSVDVRAPGGRDEVVRIDNTYLVHMQDGSSFTVRLTSGPLPSDAVARTVVNTTKVGATAVERGGAVTNVQVEGRYVVQLNERMDPLNADRAIAHEIGEILGERKLAVAKGVAGPDLLRPGAVPEAGAALSPHDQGRLGEIRSRAGKVNAGDAGARREMLALVEELGLREGTPGSLERRHLVFDALRDQPDARTALEWASQPELHLEPDARAQLGTIRDARREYQDAQAVKADATTPLHETPDASPAPGERISPERARELALEAAIARERRSGETLANLRAEARHGRPKVGDVQIGGGAALAARDPNALLIDGRGRWQAVASDRRAQTANQLKGLKDAGIGDPFQFAEPNERVPMSAVRYWEDSVAAQGPVINGEVTRIAIDEHGKTILTIKPKDGPAIEVEVAGNLAMASGFPVERLPGNPRGMSPDQAVDQVKAVLQGILDDPRAKHGQKVKAQAALHDIEDRGLTGLETKPGQRERDLSSLRDVLKRHHLEQTVEHGAGDAHKMVVAGDKWEQLTKDHPDTFVLGDVANLERMDPMATDRWIIGGLGGTGISAAEIVLAKNPNAHVAMVGDKPPAGLLENDQFMHVLKQHADQPTVDKLNAMYGLNLVPGVVDQRFALVFDVKVETPTVDRGGKVRAKGEGRAADFVPDGYDRSNNPMVGGGYISAIGRDGQLPPVVAALRDSVEAQGGKVTMQPKYDSNGQYTHYEVTAKGAPDASGARPDLRKMDITGAASRFPPWELFEGDAAALELAQKKFWAASDLDAPPESGNFDGGFVSSATQAARYARERKGSGTP